MAVAVKMAAPWRRHTNGQRTLTFSPGTVGPILDALVAQLPDLRRGLYGAEDQLKPTVRTFRGEADIEAVGGLSAEAPDGEVISIVPPVAGA